ncbi:MAG: serine/threonine protein kinase [Phycisphaerales bacterium]|nr:serine/threonine protein kinase [Phycisphaerales bacterium]
MTEATADRVIDEIRRMSATVGPFRLAMLRDRLKGLDDDALADVFLAFGEAMEELDALGSVTLQDFMDVLPDLPERPVVLDAAIETVLRAMVGFGLDPSHASSTLEENYPELRDAVRTSAMLSEALASTRTETPERPRRIFRPLPEEFGPELAPGMRRYELRERIGAGSHGVVYRAIDRKLSGYASQAMVAIKVIDAKSTSALARDRLVAEAIKARRIDHSNVVRVLDRGVSGEDEDFVVFEYVEGDSLSDHFKRHGRPSPKRAAEIVRQIADGVQAAHNAQVVHCDLKPANIIIDELGRVRVADFGLSVRTDGFIDEESGRKRLLGNLAFMSPEQFRAADGAYMPAADIYALGGILYWLLTGAYPNGASREEVEHYLHGFGGEPRSPSILNPSVDEDLEAICLRALSPDAHHRQASAAGVADDLRAWLGHEPLAWRSPTLARRTRLYFRRKPKECMAITGLLLVLLAGAGLAAHTEGRHRLEKAEAQLMLAEQREKLLESRHQAELSERLIEQTQQFVADSLPMLHAHVPNPTWEVLPMLALLEETIGTPLMKYGNDGTLLYHYRFEIAERVLERYESAGMSHSIEALYWQLSLGFWKQRAWEPEEARAILEANLEGWRAAMPDDHAWLDYVGILTAASIASVEMRKPEHERDTEALQEAVAMLLRHDEICAGPRWGSPIHRTVGQTMNWLPPEVLGATPEQRALLERTLTQEWGVRLHRPQ